MKSSETKDSIPQEHKPHIKRLIDEIAQDSLETNLSNLILHREYHEKQEVSSLFLQLNDAVDGLFEQLEALREAAQAYREAEAECDRTGEWEPAREAAVVLDTILAAYPGGRRCL